MTDDLPPTRLGFCSHVRKHGSICGAAILSDDIDWVETTLHSQERRTFCCGSCVDAVLGPKPESALDPDRSRISRRVVNPVWAHPDRGAGL